MCRLSEDESGKMDGASLVSNILNLLLIVSFVLKPFATLEIRKFPVEVPSSGVRV
jgi:hypothetical protein